MICFSNVYLDVQQTSEYIGDVRALGLDLRSQDVLGTGNQLARVSGSDQIPGLSSVQGNEKD